MEGFQPISLFCTSGVLTKNLEYALFYIWKCVANVNRYASDMT